MGLFSKSKKESTKTVKTNWTDLTTVAQLDEAVVLSNSKTVVLFKHSTRCSISASVLNKFEKQISEDVQVFYLDLIAYREVSNAIAEKFAVEHQSPQALVLRNGKVIANDSHYGINELKF